MNHENPESTRKPQTTAKPRINLETTIHMETTNKHGKPRTAAKTGRCPILKYVSPLGFSRGKQ